jgi:hypothetical protein
MATGTLFSCLRLARSEVGLRAFSNITAAGTVSWDTPFCLTAIIIVIKKISVELLIWNLSFILAERFFFTSSEDGSSLLCEALS